MNALTPIELEILKRLELTPQINDEKLIKEKMLRVNTVIKHRQEVIEKEQLKIELLKRDLENLQQSLVEEKNQILKKRQELDYFKHSLVVKYNLKNNWGYNPDTGELT